MEALAEVILKNIISGGPGALITILVAICALFGYWIVRLEKVISKKDERLDDVIDKNAAASHAVAESLNQLRIMIFELVRSK